MLRHGPTPASRVGRRRNVDALVTLGLVAVGAAHETGMASVVDGTVIAVVSIMPLEPGDEAKARFYGDRP